MDPSKLLGGRLKEPLYHPYSEAQGYVMSASDRTLTSVGEAYVKDILLFLPEAGVLLGG